MNPQSAAIYDTHAAIQRLTSKGMPEPQAEAVIHEQFLILEHNLATKVDIADTNARIEQLRQETKVDIELVKADIEKLRLETKADIATVKADIIKWVLGLNIALAALIITVMQLG